MSILARPPKALLFDVFGTCTDWRTTIPRELASRASSANSTIAATIAPSTWTSFSLEWRDAYKHFVSTFQPGTTPWRDIDALHHEALVALLPKYGLAALWTDAEVRDISLLWHRLDGWPDAGRGMRALNDLGLKTATLSNGNSGLLHDLAAHADLPFARILSAEDARTEEGEHAYKPHPAVYRYGAEALGLETEECALVAAHLHDLKGAKAVGMRAVYVERRDEEACSREEVEKARDEGWVDLWIDGRVEDGGRGFEEVAEVLGQAMGRG
jgi:2-haloacid dehalogenase